ncbi:MAG: hypothetical protein WBG32_22610 [Nodosilinea sp.]
MTALYDQWQAARQLRQSEVVSRRDQVSTDLERWQADRLTHAVQLRQNLDQLMADLRTNTALWLIQTTADREVQILPRQQVRQDYLQQLQVNTEVLLATYQTDRQLSAAEVRQKLEHDCQVLQNSVCDLRLEIAQELRQIQQQVAEIQAQTRQQQAMTRADLLPKLTAYVEDLQVQVQATLKDLTAVRQQTAVVHQEQRQSDRQALSASVDAMFTELADFRHQLQAQRAQLSHIVWGGDVTALPAAAPASRPAATRPAVTSTPARTVATTKPAPKPVAKLAAVPPIAKAAPAKASAKAAPTTPAPARAVARSAPVATVMEPVALAAPVAEVVTPSPAPEVPSLEEVVYNYLHLSQGARLGEIETELGINRFQAVDALRSLIQKDLVVKQDRTYLVQEEAVL